jgi:hypothetical protein
VFPSTEPKSVALWTGIYNAQKDALGIISEAYREVREVITQGDLSEYDGFTVLGHLNAAVHAMNLAVVKAERELAKHKWDAKLPAEPEPEPAPPVKLPAKKNPEPAPAPEPETIDEGDVEVTDEPQPINEPVEPPKAPPPPKPATTKAAAKTPGHVEQLVADIKTELARFGDWAHYARVFFDNKANDVDVLAGKVTDVKLLSTILAALKKLPPTATKTTGKGNPPTTP